MEVDEHLKYSLYVFILLCFLYIMGPTKCSFLSDPLPCSLQFDPAPRRGEPHVTRRTPDCKPFPFLLQLYLTLSPPRLSLTCVYKLIKQASVVPLLQLLKDSVRSIYKEALCETKSKATFLPFPLDTKYSPVLSNKTAWHDSSLV